MADAQFLTGQQTAASSTNKVLRSTYMLLSMTLVFSATMAGVAMIGSLMVFAILNDLVLCP